MRKERNLVYVIVKCLGQIGIEVCFRVGILRLSSLCQTIADCMKPKVTDCTIYLYFSMCKCSVIDIDHYSTILQHLVLYSWIYLIIYMNIYMRIYIYSMRFNEFFYTTYIYIYICVCVCVNIWRKIEKQSNPKWRIYCESRRYHI